MSIDIRCLTNGSMTIYRVIDRSAGTFDIYNSIEEIPKSIRHYAPTSPLTCGPDVAGMFGVIDILYPNFPNCGHPDYCGRPCIAEACMVRGERHWAECKHFGGAV
jgi:hypothetical protein